MQADFGPMAVNAHRQVILLYVPQRRDCFFDHVSQAPFRSCFFMLFIRKPRPFSRPSVQLTPRLSSVYCPHCGTVLQAWPLRKRNAHADRLIAFFQDIAAYHPGRDGFYVLQNKVEAQGLRLFGHVDSTQNMLVVGVY